MTWEQKLKREFNIDIETSKICDGRVKIVACVEDPIVIERILDNLKEKAETNGTDPFLQKVWRHWLRE